MTKDELLTYYRENKNINDEITLLGSFTGCKYKFRHYMAYYTKKDYWLHPINGLLYDTSDLLSGYEIPKNEELFNSLKVGDIIVVNPVRDNKLYYKKIDNDVFIECDNAGHINSCKYVGNSTHRIKFIYDSEEILKLYDSIEKLNEVTE